jgi:hypothetical protein
MVKQGKQHLNIMKTCQRNIIFANEFMCPVNVNTVLLAVVTYVILFHPPCAKILLGQAVWALLE